MPADDQSSWIIRGNFVVPTRNPFARSDILLDDHDDDDHLLLGSSASASIDDNQDDAVIVLGPGLIMLVDHIMEVKEGFIAALMPSRQYQQEKELVSLDGLRLRLNYVELDLAHEFVVPGLIDLHIHAPQYSYTGTATDRPLMGVDGWLETYTFPAESRLADNLELARDVYRKVVRSTLSHGTTTALYYATLHVEPTKVLADVTMELGQRALIGKVCMDRNAPDHYLHSAAQNVNDTEAFIRYVRSVAGDASVMLRKDMEDDIATTSRTRRLLLPRVLPVITPRFIPTCTPGLLSALGQLAKKHDCHVTTHASESIDEVEFTRHLDVTEDGGNGTRTDSTILDSHKLLTPKCVLAHGVHLSEADTDLLRQRGTAVAHCPLSNFFFAGGTLPTRSLLERGNHVGLGTDVAGGYHPSMWHSCRMAVVASHALQHQQRRPDPSPSTAPDKSEASQAKDHVLDYRHALYLATLGGAQALGLDRRIGTFRVGMEFDAVVLSAAATTASSSPIDVFETDTLSDVFQKLCVLGDDRNVRRVFVQGRDVTVGGRG